MSGQDMIDGVRELLHDSGRGFATDDRLYVTDEILRRLNESKERVAKMLIASSQPALVAINRKIAYSSLTDGAMMPDGFWKLLGGNRADWSWIPSAPMTKAEPLLAVGHDFCYVRGGQIFGPQSKALYYVAPTETIEETAAALTEFSDSVYFVIQLLAARELLPQEKADAVDRWQLMSKMLTEEMQTFS